MKEKRDALQRTWVLAQSDLMGSYGDLWLAEKVDGKLVHPLFTGVSLEKISPWIKSSIPEPTFDGKTAKQLLSGYWFKTLVGNPELSKDSSGSGLTDIEKIRLGLSLDRSDSDGDGDLDGVDPWPNAPNRMLSDEEQILAAAFEGRFYDDHRSAPGVFFARPGMKPFEMPGRSSLTIWVASENYKPNLNRLNWCYEQGATFISFSGEPDQNGARQDLIHWNKEHTIAYVSIATYRGGKDADGYVVTVAKKNNVWKAVEKKMTWIS